MDEPTTPQPTTAEPQPDQPTRAPDATISITWDGQRFQAAVERSPDLNQPAAHLADWIGRNMQPLTMMAAVDWNTRQELAAAQQPAAEREKQAETATPLRLVSPHGGPLQ